MTAVPFTPRDQRLAPLAADQRSPLQSEMLATLTRPGRPTPNVFATLVRNEDVFQAWLPFLQRMLSTRLPSRWQEITILRVAVRCDSFYEWGQHAVLGRDAGLSDDEIRDLRNPCPSRAWPGVEAALIRAVDQIHDHNGWTDDLWSELQGHMSHEQAIELLMLIGQYHLVAFALNSLGVQLERPSGEDQT